MQYADVLWLSFRTAGSGILVAMLMGIPIGVLLSWRKVAGRDLWDVFVTIPMVLPPTVLGYYLLVAMGQGTWVDRVWRGLTGGPIVFSFAGCVVAAAVAALPFVVKSTRTAMEEIDPGLLSAAMTLGAGSWRRFWTVRLPLALRGIAAGCMLGFARAIGDFGATLMIGGNIPGRTRTAPLAVYDLMLRGDDAGAAGLALALCALAVFLLLGANIGLKRRAMEEGARL
jgi:molybdate transport system permease protein